MRISPAALSPFLLATLTACQVDLATDCSKTAHRAARLELAGVSRIVLDTGAGELLVTGRADTTVLEAEGTACAGTEARLDDLQIFHEKRGEVLHLWTDRSQEPQIRIGWVEDSGRLDLTVQVPSNLPIDIDDGSGGTVIKSVSTLRLEDGSGDLDLADLRGDVTIEDGSGSLTLVGADGNVRIEDGSGEVAITGVKGDVVAEDGSGDLTIRQVGGAVTITEDGSGEIAITGAGRGVHIRNDGSGSIVLRDITGDVRVEEDGSGTIETSGVTGKVEIPEGKRRDR
ncbi:MAG: hypothetical protein SF066_01445 [Thermoanaerobaculia bacterium]|nr:hypothetical protein [Thermoanaerobaculia bacterium]